jgi:glycosyltransferase involved in cell wall biosynthesis
MKILQLIDSLEAGGAERMAVNYANALAYETECSGLVTTRLEGELKNELDPKVKYIFLNRKSTIDYKAVLKLRSFVKKHKFQIIHAHSSSFFISCLLKLIMPSIKIIWHDHYGNSEFLEQRKETKVLKLFSYMFLGIISVNLILKQWADNCLNCKRVIYLPNFVLNQQTIEQEKKTFLNGQQGKRIVCLANLRLQKNHHFLLEIAKRLKSIHPDWTFHLIGKNFKDEYAQSIIDKIREYELSNTVYLYGSCNDINHILSQAEIGILTSSSEGLPVSILEYGFNKLAVIATNVGEIPNVVLNNDLGFLVASNDTKSFLDSLNTLILDDSLRQKLKNNFFKYTMHNFSQSTVIKKYLNWINNQYAT